MLSEWESNQLNYTITRFEGDPLLNDIQKLYYTDHYDLVIEQTTKILEDLQRQSMTTSLYQRTIYLLEVRIMAWQAKSSYTNALTDAQELIKYAPRNPKGYLWSGQLYAHLGKQEHGVELFRKGLKLVTCSPSDERYNQKLKQGIQFLEKQHHPKKKDILVSLPYELSCRILDQLCQRTLAHCSNVNSSWRTLVINYPKIWRYIEIPVFDVEDIYLPLYKLLPFITKHIQELVLHEQEDFKKCIDLMGRNNFENLCILKANLRSCIPSILGIYHGDIYSSLTNVSDTLTNLEFEFHQIQGLHLAPLLSILRNLTSLRLHVTWDTNNGGILGALKMPSTTLLTALYLHYETKYDCVHVAFKVDEIQQLVRSSPHLRHLYISSCPDEIYNEVSLHCPNIQQLIINAWYLPFMTINDESPGLKRLLLGNVRSGIALKSLLTDHASTITTLRLVEDDVYAATSGPWNIFSIVNFSNLVSITMSNVEREISQQLPRIIHGTSQLETLKLDGINDIIPDSVFEALVVKFPNFRNLTLHSCYFSDAALSNCLDSFATGRARSSLKTLDIYPSKEYTNDIILQTYTRIESLTRLSIYHRGASETAVDAFAEGVAKLTHLKKLTIYSLPMTEENLQIIGMNSSITEVCLIFSDMITREQAYRAFSPDVLVRFAYTFDDSDSDSYFMELDDGDDDFMGD